MAKQRINKTLTKPQTKQLIKAFRKGIDKTISLWDTEHDIEEACGEDELLDVGGMLSDVAAGADRGLDVDDAAIAEIMQGVYGITLTL